MSWIPLKMPDGDTDTYTRGFRCPSCGGSSVYLAKGNYLTCGFVDCPNPDVASAVTDLAASDRNANTDAANPPTLPTPTENTDIDEILDAYEIHRQDLHRSVQHLPKTREVQEEYLSRGKKIAKREILEVIKKTVLAGLEDIYHTPGNTDAAWNRLCRRINELQASKEGK